MTTGYPASSIAPPVDSARFVPHAHTVQFYEDDVFLLRGLSRLLGSALGGGDACVVIATYAHRSGVEKRLKAHGLDVALAKEQGRYVALDAEETLSRFMVDGTPDPTLFREMAGKVIEEAGKAAGGEHPRIAAFGEMVALLWAEGKPDAAIQLEELWNELARTHTFVLHCAYPMSFFDKVEDAETIGHICSAHSDVIPADGYIS